MLIELNKVESKMVCEALGGYLESLCNEMKDKKDSKEIRQQCLKVLDFENLHCFFKRETEKSFGNN